MAAAEVFANQSQTTVTSGGTDAPAQGTVQSWTVASSSSFPAAATGTSQFHVCDPAAPSEIILVSNTSGTSWTVTRGAEGTAPVAHQAGFTVFADLTAGALGFFIQNPMTALGDTVYGGTAGAPARLPGNTTAAREFLASQGTGTVATAPAWGAIAASDVPGVRGTVTTGDAIQLSGCTLTNGSAAATFAGASLTAADVGKAVVAVHNQDFLVTAISAVGSPTTVTLAAAWPGTSTSGATVTYGTDQTAAINALLAANARVVIASPVLCTGTLIVPDSTQLTGLGFSLGSVIYAGHYNNIIQSSLWGQPSLVQNQFCDAYDLTLVGLLPVTPPGLGQTDSASASTYLFTTVQLAAGTLSQVFTSGAFPVSGTLDSRWPAGSAGSPVYFWHNNVLFSYTSATPFATTSIVDPSVSSATILTHGYVYPLNSQGHGVAFQSFRGRITRVRTVNVRGSGVRVQGSGTADPTAYGHRIEWIRTESPGWAGAELGESTTDDFLDILSCTSPGVAGLIVMGGDPTVRTVHAVGQPTRPWVPHVVACPTNGSYRDVILDTCYGPGFVLDGGLQFRGVGPSETLLHGLRYLGSSGKPGHGTPILAKTRASTINVQQLGISGVTFVQDCAFLFTHGPQTEVANGVGLTLSTTASVVPVLDVTAMDPMGGKVNIVHAGLTKTVTYTGVTVNTTLTGGASQNITIGSGGTLTLSQAFPTVPVSGDWYVIGGVAAVQVDPANTGGNSLVYTTSVSLYGASGTVAIAGQSFASRQTLTGCTIVSGTQAVSTGDLTVGFQLQQGNVQGSIAAPGATGMSLPAAQPAVLVKGTDSLLVTADSQIGSGTGPAPVTVTASYTVSGSDSVIIANGAGITVTLPTAAGIAGRAYTVTNAAASTVTVSPQAGQTIAGASSYVIPGVAGSHLMVESDGTNWQVLSGALSSPGRIILVSEYAPATLTGKTVSTATLSAFDTATLTTGSFTVPPSGVVIVEVNCVAVTPTANNVYAFALAAHGTVSPVLGNVITAETSSANNKIVTGLKFRLAGLTAGSSLNLDLLGAIAANTLTIEAIGTSSTTPTAAAGGPVTFVVTEAF